MFLHHDLTSSIIGACYTTHKELGPVFLEKVYQEALSIIFQEEGIIYEREKHLPIMFRGKLMACDYIADYVIDNKIILEIKAVKELEPIHEAQVVNYLKATGYQIGLLINFGSEKLQIRRLASNIY